MILQMISVIQEIGASVPGKVEKGEHDVFWQGGDFE